MEFIVIRNFIADFVYFEFVVDILKKEVPPFCYLRIVTIGHLLFEKLRKVVELKEQKCYNFNNYREFEKII